MSVPRTVRTSGWTIGRLRGAVAASVQRRRTASGEVDRGVCGARHLERDDDGKRPDDDRDDDQADRP